MVLGSVEPDGGSATLKIMVNPMVMWIWLGGLTITLGALITMIPSRRTSAAPRGTPQVREPVPALEYSRSP
jgi:cytochrome c-type biogenesis protein CcmF